jgi:hypothetical protein
MSTVHKNSKSRKPAEPREYQQSLDDLHCSAESEFEDNPDALNLLRSIYQASLHNYKAAIQYLRLRGQQAGWIS